MTLEEARWIVSGQLFDAGIAVVERFAAPNDSPEEFLEALLILEGAGEARIVGQDCGSEVWTVDPDLNLKAGR